MAALIESITNKQIKLAKSLRIKKYRERENLFLAEGIRLSEMALAAGANIRYGLYTQKALLGERGRELIAKLERTAPLYEVTEDIFAEVADTVSPQGVILAVEKKTFSPEELAKRNSIRLFVIPDGLQDPGNLGTILRTAEAVGASVILPDSTVDPFSPKVVRSSMGAIFFLPMAVGVDRSILASTLAKYGIGLFVASLAPKATKYHETNYPPRTAIVFGSEAQGASKALTEYSQKIYIPMKGHAESLNVASAAAIIIYDWSLRSD